PSSLCARRYLRTESKMALAPAYRHEGHRVRLAERAADSDRRLQLLGDAESDFLRGLDLDRLAGLGIDSHTGLALAHLEDAEGGQADAVALLEVLADGGDEGLGELV